MKASSIRQTLTGLAGQCADFFAPKSCCSCGGLLPADRANSIVVCDECVKAVAPQIPHRCVKCAAAVGPYADTESGCVHCRDKPIRFDSVVCLGMYDEAMRKAVLSAKWSWSSIGIEALAGLLVREQSAALTSLNPELIIPIPQSRAARLRRHFNSASQIASVIAKTLRVRSDEHVLRRRRSTRPQKRVSVRERFRNQRDSFRIQNAHTVNRKNVLLVDDVLTTGATCSEAARVLKKAGAADCHVAVIARVLDAA